MKTFISFLSSIAAFSIAAHAEPPKVVTDIAPVHSLVAGIMHGVETPKNLIAPGVSPHGYAMRPSEARSLQGADLVVWIGPELTPSLTESIETLAGDAVHIELLDLPGVALLPFRETAVFDTGDHDDHDDHDDHADHDDHKNHDAHDDDDDHSDHAEHSDHEDHAEHDAHDAGEDQHAHAHDHDGVDPHAWLDPVNAQIWVQAVAAKLAEMDPANAAVYDTNAAVMAADLQDLIDQTSALLEPVKGQRFLVFHDAYQYFETRFGLKLAGAIVQSDGVPPSAARLHALQEELEREQVNCIFSEPQFNPGVLNALTETKEISTAELDPIGVGLQLGPELYISVLSHMAQDFASCLATQS